MASSRAVYEQADISRAPADHSREGQHLLTLAQALKQQHGAVFAQRWLAEQLSDTRYMKPPSDAEDENQEYPTSDEALCPTYQEAVTLLERDRDALGVAYDSLLLLAWLSLDQASERDPTPHLQTALWVLAEMSGKHPRTLQRHLLEHQHPWSATVSKWLDIRPVYGERLEGIDTTTGEAKRKKRYVGVVYRFFPRTRLSSRARIGRFGARDLIAASDAEQTQFSRPRRVQEKLVRKRYGRGEGLMSSHSSPKLQIYRYNWYIENLSLKKDNFSKEAVNVCGDIPRRRVLDELLCRREALLCTARERGASLARARSRWVEAAASVLARAFNDHGFTNLWRKVLWTAIKTEMYGGTTAGWRVVQRLVDLADENIHQPGLKRPVACAYARVKEDLDLFARDYGGGRAGAILPCLPV